MRLVIEDGELLVEPDMPPWTAFGGMQGVYLPSVPTAELERVENSPALSASASRNVSNELARRRSSGSTPER